MKNSKLKNSGKGLQGAYRKGVAVYLHETGQATIREIAKLAGCSYERARLVIALAGR
jgi:hypothetical protein